VDEVQGELRHGHAQQIAHRFLAGNASQLAAEMVQPRLNILMADDLHLLRLAGGI